MSFEYDIPGLVTVTQIQPSTSISANTNSSVIDLAPYQGAVGVIAAIGANTAGDANAKWQGTIYDSADNSSFAISNAATNTFTNVTNANTTQVLDLDTRSARRYMKVVQNLYGVNTAYPVSLLVFGQKEFVPNAV